MGEDCINKLQEVSLLDIYDDIAAIRLTPEELIQTCIEIPCRVSLKRGNVVYSVEQKYKHKLVKYENSKRLKWLKVNLKAIVPNPEEKILKWQARHRENKKSDWLQRKLHALDYLDKETRIDHSEEAFYQSEEPCCSRSLFLAGKRRISQQTFRSSRSTIGNTSTESVQTVIESQPKNTQETDFENLSPVINFKQVSSNAHETEIEECSPLDRFNFVSRSTLSSSSGELPSLCVEASALSQENEFQTKEKSTDPNADERDIGKEAELCRKILLQESEEPSTHEEAYTTFYQDMQVTSTQEFG